MAGAAAGRKGRRNEHRTQHLLERLGYHTVRSAGSLGPFDVVGISATEVVLIQVKTNGWPGTHEMETMREFPCPTGTRKVIHRWNDRAYLPVIKEVT